MATQKRAARSARAARGARAIAPAPVESRDLSVDDLEQSLRQLAERVRKVIEAAANDAATLEVRTFAAADGLDLNKAGYDVGAHAFVNDGKPIAVQLRALTAIELDGDINSVVPFKGGAVDRELWELHQNLVAQAQANRADMLVALANLARGIAGK